MKNSKPKSDTEVKAYSMIRKDGGYQVVEFTIADSKIKSIEEVGTQDVFAIAHIKLMQLIRKSLGL